MVLPGLDEIVENFTLFDDWEERYRYLIDLGRRLPALDDTLKRDEYLVRGCTSRVWLVPQIDEGGVFTFKADSDAHIVRGLIVILMAAYQGQAVDDLANVDIDEAFRRIGMDQHLSINRRNGFFSMVEVIKSYGSC
ncbi:MAG: SufE family protein [Alphaproteobacteria bacterium]